MCGLPSLNGLQFTLYVLYYGLRFSVLRYAPSTLQYAIFIMQRKKQRPQNLLI